MNSYRVIIYNVFYFKKSYSVTKNRNIQKTATFKKRTECAVFNETADGYTNVLQHIKNRLQRK